MEPLTWKCPECDRLGTEGHAPGCRRTEYPFDGPGPRTESAVRAVYAITRTERNGSDYAILTLALPGRVDGRDFVHVACESDWALDSPAANAIQTDLNRLLIRAEESVGVSDEAQVELRLTREQADEIAATREYRLFCLGAPDALKHDLRRSELRYDAERGLPLSLDNGDVLYGIRVVVDDPAVVRGSGELQPGALPPRTELSGTAAVRAALGLPIPTAEGEFADPLPPPPDPWPAHRDGEPLWPIEAAQLGDYPSVMWNVLRRHPPWVAAYQEAVLAWKADREQVRRFREVVDACRRGFAFDPSAPLPPGNSVPMRRDPEIAKASADVKSDEAALRTIVGEDVRFERVRGSDCTQTRVTLTLTVERGADRTNALHAYCRSPRWTALVKQPAGTVRVAFGPTRARELAPDGVTVRCEFYYRDEPHVSKPDGG